MKSEKFCKDSIDDVLMFVDGFFFRGGWFVNVKCYGKFIKSLYGFFIVFFG